MMIEFLQIANEGISLNTIAFKQPTHIYRSNLCPTGLGGYSHEGWAWRSYLPKELKFCASNNLLKHLVAVISPWVDFLAYQLNPNNCALSMTNSTMLKRRAKAETVSLRAIIYGTLRRSERQKVWSKYLFLMTSSRARTEQSRLALGT
jgi:hypothetical protein